MTATELIEKREKRISQLFPLIDFCKDNVRQWLTELVYLIPKGETIETCLYEWYADDEGAHCTLPRKDGELPFDFLYNGEIVFNEPEIRLFLYQLKTKLKQHDSH